MSTGLDQNTARGIRGIKVDYLEWQGDLIPGVSVELVELLEGDVDLSQIYVKPGTVLELDELEFLESKIAL